MQSFLKYSFAVEPNILESIESVYFTIGESYQKF